jgi:hypothetical protein
MLPTPPPSSRLSLRALCAALLLCLLAATSADAAPKRSTSVKLPVPAKGQVNAVFGTVKAKNAKIAVKKAPAGVALVGGLRGGRLAVAAVGTGAATGTVELRVTGRGKVKPKGLKVARDLVGRGGAPKTWCSGGALGRLLGRPLRGIAGGDASALGRALMAKGCLGEVAAADAAVLARLTGAGGGPAPGGGPAAPTPGAKPATTSSLSKGGTITAPRPGGGIARPGGNPTGGTGPVTPRAACDNGVDDDGDGQFDARTPSRFIPDPGCSDVNDDTEGSEVPVSAECAKTSGIFIGQTRSSAMAAINDPCPLIEEVYMTIVPGVKDCVASSAASNYSCSTRDGLLYARRTGGQPDNRIDFFTINLTGDRDCNYKPSLVIVSPDGVVHELDEPWPGASCTDPGQGPQKAACENGLDDDGDGQTDAPDLAGTSDPDPGCSSAGDQSEDSEIGLPQGCSVQIVTFGQDPKDTGFIADGCGTLIGGSFTPPGTPTDCIFAIGGNDQQCSVVGATGSATFGATADELRMLVPIAAQPACFQPITVALRRQDGAVLEGRGTWQC